MSLSQTSSLVPDSRLARSESTSLRGSFQVLAGLPCGVVVLDSLLTIVYANPAACRWMGISAEATAGVALAVAPWDLATEAGGRLLWADTPAVVAVNTGRVHRQTLMLRSLGGERRVWLDVTAEPDVDRNGRVSGVTLTLVDVTPHFAVRASRDAAHQVLTEVINSVPVGVLVCRPSGAITFANTEAERFFLLPSVELGERRFVGRFWSSGGNVMSGEELIQVALGRGRRGQSIAMGRLTWESNSGRQRVLEVFRTTLPSAPDKFVVLTFADVTQDEASAQAIRAAQQRLSTTMSAAGLGQLQYFPESRTLTIGRDWLARTGLPIALAETELNTWLQTIRASDRALFTTNLERHRLGETPSFDTSVWIDLPNLSPLRLRIFGQFEDGGGRGHSPSFSGVLLDITAESQAKEARDRLEANAAEMARLEGIAAVAGGVAHTFSNLMGGVLGVVTALQDAPVEGPLAEALGVITEAGAVARDITAQLRGISGHGRFRLVRTDLRTQAREMLPILRTGLVGQANVVVEDGDAPLVEADADQLRLMLMNLVLNAADAMDGMHGTVRVVTRAMELTDTTPLPGLATPERPQNGAYALLEVVDNGIGMNEEVRRRMFEPFFTTRSDRRGLGLSAVLGIARGHGGFVQVRSSLGEGTRVSLALPALGESVARPKGVRRKLSPAVTPVSSAARKRVLVADDEPVIRRLVSRLLTRAGYDVELVCDGREALDRLLSDAPKFDLLILDLSMPGMSGSDVLNITADRLPDLPILVMSGYSEDDLVSELISVNNASFLPKPFTAEELLQKTRDVVGHETPQRDGALS